LSVSNQTLKHQNTIGQTMKTLAIVSQKGGAGKTTIAVHLAVAAEHRGLTVAIFDLDPQASATSWGDKRGTNEPAVVPAQPSRLPALIAQAKEQGADLVIIDSAPSADTGSLAAAKVADMLLIPCRPAAFDLDAVGATLGLATMAGKPAAVVLNAVPSQGRIGEEARETLTEGNVTVAKPVLHQLIAFAHSVVDGRTAQELDPKSKAAQEIEALLDWIVAQLDIQTLKHSNTKTAKHA
jgi:chromosome partitioning protein